MDSSYIPIDMFDADLGDVLVGSDGIRVTVVDVITIDDLPLLIRGNNLKRTAKAWAAAGYQAYRLADSVARASAVDAVLSYYHQSNDLYWD